MPLADDVRTVLATLEEHGIEHMLVGGVAQEALGVPRTTFDVDLQVSLAAPPSPAASSWMGWIIEERTRDAVFGQDVLIIHVPLSSTPFELFLTSHWLTKQALARRVTRESALLGRKVAVPTPEDFMLMKAAHMASASRSERKRAQDALDIEQVAAASLTLDRAYLREHATRLGLWEQLERLLP